MNNTLKGMTMAGLAAVFWGSMGVAGQYLLQNCHFTPMDLISIRMLLAGSIFGLLHWSIGAATHQPATSGTVMLAALPILVGIQCLIAFLHYDVSNVPNEPVSLALEISS